jgi:hypothetical protein
MSSNSLCIFCSSATSNPHLHKPACTSTKFTPIMGLACNLLLTRPNPSHSHWHSVQLRCCHLHAAMACCQTISGLLFVRRFDCEILQSQQPCSKIKLSKVQDLLTCLGKRVQTGDVTRPFRPVPITIHPPTSICSPPRIHPLYHRRLGQIMHATRHANCRETFSPAARRCKKADCCTLGGVVCRGC